MAVNGASCVGDKYWLPVRQFQQNWLTYHRCRETEKRKNIAWVQAQHWYFNLEPYTRQRHFVIVAKGKTKHHWWLKLREAVAASVLAHTDRWSSGRPLAVGARCRTLAQQPCFLSKTEYHSRLWSSRLRHYTCLWCKTLLWMIVLI